MKKICFLLLFLVAIAFHGFSQIKLGVRVGVNSNYIKSAEETVDGYKITVPKDVTTGFHFGLVGQVQLFSFFVQPEILFSSNRNDIIITDLTAFPVTQDLSEHKFNLLNIPVMLGYKFKALKFEVGPVGTVLLRSKSDLLKDKGFEQELKAMTYGYQAGIGLDLGKLAIDFKYEGNLSKFGDGLKFNNQTYSFDQRANQLIFSVGLFF